MRRLLFTAEPQPDESFIGYLIRLMELNDYGTLSWILQMAQLNNYANNLSFSFNPSLNLTPLAELAGVREEQLRPLLYQPVRVSKNRLMGEYAVFGHPLPRYLIRYEQPKICAPCLRESGYARKIWELSPVTACPIHRCLLLDKCLNCRKQISWNRRGLSECRCKFDWREATPPNVEESQLRVTRYIYRLCNLPGGGYMGDESLGATHLNKLGLGDFLSALFFIASQYAGIIDTKGKHLAPKKRNSELHELLCKAVTVFDAWPHNYFSFLDWRREQNTAKISTEQQAKIRRNKLKGWQRDFVEYKSALFLQLAAPELKFMRDAFKDYAEMRRRESYLARAHASEGTSKARRARRIWRAPLSDEYISGKGAIKALRVSWEGLDRLIAAGKLKAVVSAGGSGRVFMVDRASVEQLKVELDDALYLQDVERLTGLQPKWIKELAVTGVLNPIRAPHVDGNADWRFGRREVLDLLSRFENSVVKQEPVPGEEPENNSTLSFDNTARKLRRAGVGFIAFICAILEGNIKPSGIGKGDGIRRLLFSCKQVSEYIDEILRLQAGGALPLPLAAEMLGVSQTDTRTLVKRGLLVASKMRNLEAMGLMVMPSEWEAFKATYVLAREIAQSLGTDAFYIVRSLAAKGIHPVAGPGIDGKRLYVFRRTDVAGIDLKPPATPQASSIIGLEEAARLLTLSVDDVRRLVGAGIFKPYKQRKNQFMNGKTEEYYFSAYVLEKYKREAMACEDLVSSTAAAQMMGIRVDKLHIKYVRTGRLVATKITSGNRGNLYFRRIDVKALITEEQEKVRASDAAAILNINPSCVHKLTVAGLLTPVSGPSIDGFGYNIYIRSEVEKLRAEREAFKRERMASGKTTRYGYLKPRGKSVKTQTARTPYKQPQHKVSILD